MVIQKRNLNLSPLLCQGARAAFCVVAFSGGMDSFDDGAVDVVILILHGIEGG